MSEWMWLVGLVVVGEVVAFALGAMAMAWWQRPTPEERRLMELVVMGQSARKGA